MSAKAALLDPASQPIPAAPRLDLGMAPRSRIVRDFMLLITVCLSVGLTVGVGMMVAVLALF